MYVCMYVCIQSLMGWDFLDSGNAIKREPRSVTPKRKKTKIRIRKNYGGSNRVIA